MKKIIMLLLIALMVNNQQASAHSKLESSSPKAGETVTGPLSEITLKFNTEIEESSTFTFLYEGEKDIPVENISIEGDTLSGTVPENLENGSYSVNWDIVGADTHVIKDSLSFTVQREEAADEEREQTPEEKEPKEETAPPDDEELQKGESTEKETSSDNEQGQSSFLLPIIGGILVLAVIVIAISMRKKK
ncbi:copper resistance CopC family protein [Metabacillus sp. 84]|uniref:copper resistance CopC family protein n=1 Tax=unclassified Metabacillus TaxID=2675274 RepID=UPI003CF820E1